MVFLAMTLAAVIVTTKKIASAAPATIGPDLLSKFERGTCAFGMPFAGSASDPMEYNKALTIQ